MKLFFVVFSIISLVSEIPNVVPEEPGTYFVEIFVEEDSSVNQTISITILFPTTIEDQLTSIAIDASDFTITESEWEKVTDVAILQRSNSKAWDTKTGNQLPISVKDKIKITTSHYDVVLQAENTQKIISVFVINDPTITYSYENYQIIDIFDSPSSINETREIIYLIIVWLVIPIAVILFLLMKLSFFNKKVTSLLYENRRKK